MNSACEFLAYFCSYFFDPGIIQITTRPGHNKVVIGAELLAVFAKVLIDFRLVISPLRDVIAKSLRRKRGNVGHQWKGDQEGCKKNDFSPKRIATVIGNLQLPPLANQALKEPWTANLAIVERPVIKVTLDFGMSANPVSRVGVGVLTNVIQHRLIVSAKVRAVPLVDF